MKNITKLALTSPPTSVLGLTAGHTIIAGDIGTSTVQIAFPPHPKRWWQFWKWFQKPIEAPVEGGEYIEATTEDGPAEEEFERPWDPIVMREASAVAYRIVDKAPQLVGLGREAKKMLGKTGSNITAVRPLEKGASPDNEVTYLMLHGFLNALRHKHPIAKNPTMILGVPQSLQDNEITPMILAAKDAGAKDVYIVTQAMATAIGAAKSGSHCDINSRDGVMVINIGGGTAEIALITNGGTVAFETVKIAGDNYDRAIIDYLAANYGLDCDELGAERLKIEASAAKPEQIFEVEGQKIVPMGSNDARLPMVIEITLADYLQAIQPVTEALVDAVIEVFNKLQQPGLIRGLVRAGIIFAGGSSNVNGLENALGAAINRYMLAGKWIKLIRPNNPQDIVVLGLLELAKDPILLIQVCCGHYIGTKKAPDSPSMQRYNAPMIQREPGGDVRGALPGGKKVTQVTVPEVLTPVPGPGHPDYEAPGESPAAKEPGEQEAEAS